MLLNVRYMDYELMTMWLSVDPMADKYPGISPYAYCAWNPVKLVDPDGREIWEINEVQADGFARKVKDRLHYPIHYDTARATSVYCNHAADCSTGG